MNHWESYILEAVKDGGSFSITIDDLYTEAYPTITEYARAIEVLAFLNAGKEPPVRKDAKRKLREFCDEHNLIMWEDQEGHRINIKKGKNEKDPLV